MPIRPIPGSDHRYALIAFDKHGEERLEAGGLISDVPALLPGAVTDLFVEVHGWKGDIPAAIDQYDRWFAALAAQEGARRESVRPAFLGLHWPSLPWGDEEVVETMALAANPAADAALVDAYVERLGGDEALRAPVAAIVAAASDDPAPATLPADVVAAYGVVEAMLNLVAEGPLAPPGHDQPVFDPEATYQEARITEYGFGDGISLGGLLAPLRQLSFWSMKKRARTVGEAGFHPLLQKLRARAGAGTRIHVMGHSFGCIAACAAIAGLPEATPLRVHSLVLVQGAVSLWTFCERLPFGGTEPGYFHRLLASGAIAGPIVTTRSRFDRAVGNWYPLGAGIANQIGLDANLPRFGGIGSFGAQGLRDNAVDSAMLPAGESYEFPGSGRVLNLEASTFIRHGGGASGAHNDIDGPEVAHLTWSAAMARV